MPPEREQRAAAPAHATGAVQFVDVDDIAPDESFRLRADGDVSDLATALGRLGQLSPIELRPWPGAAGAGPRWQVVSGFRRLAAVRMLARERVLARLHVELGDEDAWGLALGEALLHEPLTGEDLESLRERLRASSVAPWAEELVDEALVRAPVAAELRERFYEFLNAGEAASSPLAAPPTTTPTPTPTADATATSSAAPAPAEPSQPRDPAPGRGERDQGSTADAVPTASETPVAIPAETSSPASASQPPQVRDPAPDRCRDQAPGEALAAAALPAESVDAPAENPPADDFIEVTPDELVQDLVGRLAALNQDLATAVEAWKDLPPEGRSALVDQARYVAALLPFMETQD